MTAEGCRAVAAGSHEERTGSMGMAVDYTESGHVTANLKHDRGATPYPVYAGRIPRRSRANHLQPPLQWGRPSPRNQNGASIAI